MNDDLLRPGRAASRVGFALRAAVPVVMLSLVASCLGNPFEMDWRDSACPPGTENRPLNGGGRNCVATTPPTPTVCPPGYEPNPPSEACIASPRPPGCGVREFIVNDPSQCRARQRVGLACSYYDQCGGECCKADARGKYRPYVYEAPPDGDAGLEDADASAPDATPSGDGSAQPVLRYLTGCDCDPNAKEPLGRCMSPEEMCAQLK